MKRVIFGVVVAGLIGGAALGSYEPSRSTSPVPTTIKSEETATTPEAPLEPSTRDEVLEPVTPPADPQEPVEPEPEPEPEPAPPAPWEIYPNTYPSKWATATESTGPRFDDWGNRVRGAYSYAAWKVKSAYGLDLRWSMCQNAGWVSCATKAGIPTGSIPKVGSVGVDGQFVAWVEAVENSNITWSYYNLGNDGEYHIGQSASGYFPTYIYFGE